MKPTFKTERSLWNQGFKLVCGIDEAGRGALAGPLVSAAVILKPKSRCRYNDSKLLTASTRAKLFDLIKEESLGWSVGIASVEEINKFGIQSATYLSYERAYSSVLPEPDHLLLDHYRMPGCSFAQISITKGDCLSQSIAAASIVAKETRDKLMRALSEQFSVYGFDKHMGYGTKKHLDMLARHGPCEIHRVNFIDKTGKIKLNFK